jgi:hypothetical protein
MSAMLTERCLLTLAIDVGDPVVIGEVGGVLRRCIPLLGGSVSGDFEGIVLPGGTDWQKVWPSGMIELEARYALELKQGLVEVRSEGLRSGPPAVLERLAKGQAVAAHEYYFRTAMRFCTASPALSHLNELLAISFGERRAKQVLLAVYPVL